MKKPSQRERVTEQDNPASASLDRESTRDILRLINREDQTVATAVAKVIPEIARAVDLAVAALSAGGRMIYLGAGTSGRLGVLDAAECGPTFGTNQVLAVMAGAPQAMFRPAEVSEDDAAQAARDLRRAKLSRHDLLVGISASGRTPYALGGLRYAHRCGAKTVALTSNTGSPMEHLADVTIAPATGPEVVAGSTRMKAGTAQKLVLNMLSTATMVRLGRVFSGWMINVRLTNQKLRRRGCDILVKATGTSARRAADALRKSGGNLPVAMLMLLKNVSRAEADRMLRGRSPAAVLREAEKIERHG
ncbi:MAG TPA: N-acetylmuramic acid 6-phosphate etherase [Candidatus Sulfopaludibacter sp.]|nr:N-acetylmuramic acid 6-phosphate etherase [Terriglobia bacterium]HEV2444319.1 N-acetylmuramic acid 6-phosphate etherase [Candidatus Sulfopaludibacter sp.]